MPSAYDLLIIKPLVLVIALRHVAATEADWASVLKLNDKLLHFRIDMPESGCPRTLSA
jgi:hypothetical protein